MLVIFLLFKNIQNIINMLLIKNLLTFFCTFILSGGLRSLNTNFKVGFFGCGKVGTSLFSCHHIKVEVLETLQDAINNVQVNTQDVINNTFEDPCTNKVKV